MTADTETETLCRSIVPVSENNTKQRLSVLRYFTVAPLLLRNLDLI